jgi:hypothetical protein
MPFDALFASDSEMVPVGAIDEWCVKRQPSAAIEATRSGATLAIRCM